MIATKTNLEITEYREKFFLGLSLRQLACFAAAAVLAIATCFVFLHWLRMDMQVVSYIVMVEVLPFLGLGFIHRDGYPFEKLVKIYWAWHSENAAVPIRPYKESRNVQKKRTRRNSEYLSCESYLLWMLTALPLETLYTSTWWAAGNTAWMLWLRCRE